MSDNNATPDEIQGISWWNGLLEAGRAYWLEVAQGSTAKPSAADAWEAFKRVTARAKSPR
jgi:hypothetical protein